MRVLGSLGDEAKAAIPALRRILADREHRLSGGAACALFLIAPETEGLLPALLRAFADHLWEEEVPLEVQDLARAFPDLPERLAALVGDPTLAVEALDLLLELDPPPAAALPALAALPEDAPIDVWCRATLLRAALLPDGEVPVRDLAALLGSPDAGVQQKAFAILERLGPRAGEATEDLLRVLAGGSDGSVDAARILARVGEASIVGPALLEALRAFGHRDLLCAAAASLLNYPEYVPDAIDLLVAGLPTGAPSRADHFGEWLRETEGAPGAAEALGAMGPVAAGAVPALVRSLLHNGDPSRRDAAAAALVRIGEPGIAALATALDDPSPVVRQCAAFAFSQSGPAAAAAESVLRDALRDEVEAVRSEACLALLRAGFDDPAVIALLPDALLDDLFGRSAMEAAIRAGPVALPALEAALVRAHIEDRLRLRSAIHALGGRAGDLSAELAAAVERGDYIDPGDLERLGGAAAGAVPGIAALLGNPDPRCRIRAADALALIGPAAAAALPVLRLLLTDAEAEVRPAARVAWRRITSSPG
jgi:HEAT repeat protein